MSYPYFINLYPMNPYSPYFDPSAPYSQQQLYDGTVVNHSTSHTWQDYGKDPFVVNIQQAARQNNNFRTAIWSGEHLQITLMNIPVGGDVGLEIHAENDQFLRIEEGYGLVQMGKEKDALHFVRHVGVNDAIVIPTGIWHNVTNTGNTPLKMYSIYAPPHHAFGTIHQTKADDDD